MTPETRELVERLRTSVPPMCNDACRVRDAQLGCDCAMIADLIEAQAARIAELEEASDFYAGRYAERCGQLATAADAERDRIVAWLLEDENEELCTALWAENRRQRKANQFVAYPYLKLFADAIARNAHRDGQERGEG